MCVFSVIMLQVYSTVVHYELDLVYENNKSKIFIFTHFSGFRIKMNDDVGHVIMNGPSRADSNMVESPKVEKDVANMSFDDNTAAHCFGAAIYLHNDGQLKPINYDDIQMKEGNRDTDHRKLLKSKNNIFNPATESESKSEIHNEAKSQNSWSSCWTLAELKRPKWA